MEVLLCQEEKTPEEIARKAKVRELMQELDINALFKEFIGDILENGLEAELDDEFGYKGYYEKMDREAAGLGDYPLSARGGCR